MSWCNSKACVHAPFEKRAGLAGFCRCRDPKDLPVHIGSAVVDEFCARSFYFFAGYAFASRFFAAACVQEGPTTSSVLLVRSGLATGVFPVIAVAVLLARLPPADRRRRLGTCSIVVYLAFYLPIVATSTVLVKRGPYAMSER